MRLPDRVYALVVVDPLDQRRIRQQGASDRIERVGQWADRERTAHDTRTCGGSTGE